MSGKLSLFQIQVLLRDRKTNFEKNYENPSGQFASNIDNFDRAK